MKRVLTIVLFTCYFDAIFCQDYPRQDFSIEELSNLIPKIQDADQTNEDIFENLTQLLSEPIDLNNITPDQFRAYFLLSEAQIRSFYNYIKDVGPLLSVYELQAIPDWDRNTFDRIIPFVKVADSSEKINARLLKRIGQEKNNYLLFRTEKTLEPLLGSRSNTPTSNRFEGDPYKIYLRYRVAHTNDFSIGFTAEKDPGESFEWSAPKRKYGIDYLSFHVQLLNKRKIKNIIVGDFQSQFGQGLILGTAFGFGKNSETITTVKKNNLGFLPYTSVNEVNFFRGIAISYQLAPKILLHAFGSHTYKDGQIQDTTTGNEESEVTSLIETGLHRTKSELESRKQIPLTDLGAVLQFSNRSWDAGVIFHHTSFGKSFKPTPSKYNQFSFQGTQNQNVSAFINYSISNFIFFCEAATTLNHGKGIVVGTIGNLSNKMDISLHFRSYDRDFYALTSNALSESTSPQNEKGFYWGWRYTFNKKIAFNGYIDFFSFPWIRFQSYSPSNGSEWLLQLNYLVSKKTSFFLQVREENKVRNSSSVSTTYPQSKGIKRIYTINGNYEATSFLGFKTRVQASSYSFSGSDTKGIVVFQEAKLSLKRLNLSLGLALFDADNFNNRIYLYERDAWLAYSFSTYNGVGIRNYILAKYQLSKKIDFWIKWSQTKYNNQENIGTGGNTIDGNTKNDVKFQVRIKF